MHLTKKLILISAVALASQTQASTYYSDQGVWSILQTHETFSPDRRHSHCTAFRSLGDKTLFMDMDRSFIEEFDLKTDQMITLRYFDSALTKDRNARSQAINLSLDGQLIGSVQAFPIDHEANSIDEITSHSPYVLAIVDKNTSSMFIKHDGQGAATIVQKDRASANPQYLIPGIQMQLGMSEGVKLGEKDGNLKLGSLGAMPVVGTDWAIETLIECNKNVMAAEINLANASADDEINDPFELIIRRNLPDTEENQPIFIENLDNLIQAYAPSINLEISQIWSDEQLAVYGDFPVGTLRAWSGETSNGSLYYNPYVFDDLRKRKSNDFVMQCLGVGGNISRTGLKQTRELGLIGNEQIQWCRGVNGDPNSHVMHFIYSIFSEFDGASIGIEDLLSFEREETEMTDIWAATASDYPPYSE